MQLCCFVSIKIRICFKILVFNQHVRFCLTASRHDLEINVFRFLPSWVDLLTGMFFVIKLTATNSTRLVRVDSLYVRVGYSCWSSCL